MRARIESLKTELASFGGLRAQSLVITLSLALASPTYQAAAFVFGMCLACATDQSSASNDGVTAEVPIVGGVDTDKAKNATDFGSVVMIIREQDRYDAITYDGVTGTVIYGENFTKTTDYAWCSGSLIAPAVVMTAGHCLDVPRNVYIPAVNAFVREGDETGTNESYEDATERIVRKYTVVFAKDGDLRDVVACMATLETAQSCIKQHRGAVGITSVGQYRHPDYWDTKYDDVPFSRNDAGFLVLGELPPADFHALRTSPARNPNAQSSSLTQGALLEVSGFGNTTGKQVDGAGNRRVVRLVLGMLCDEDSSCPYPGDMGYFTALGGANSGDSGGPVFATDKRGRYIAGITSRGNYDTASHSAGYGGYFADFAFRVDAMSETVERAKSGDFAGLVSCPTEDQQVSGGASARSVAPHSSIAAACGARTPRVEVAPAAASRPVTLSLGQRSRHDRLRIR